MKSVEEVCGLGREYVKYLYLYFITSIRRI
nr:MAG TPA: hypothetical protein [Caudoviricetes sp.]